MVSVPDLVGKLKKKKKTTKLGCVIQCLLSESRTEQKPSMETDSSLALRYEPMPPDCRKRERQAGTLAGELAAPGAQRDLLLHVPSLGKRAAPGKNSEVESKPPPLRDPIHPKTVRNDSDINIIVSELAGIFIQVQHTREFRITLRSPVARRCRVV